MRTPLLINVVGPPCSGKSTVARFIAQYCKERLFHGRNEAVELLDTCGVKLKHALKDLMNCVVDNGDIDRVAELQHPAQSTLTVVIDIPPIAARHLAHLHMQFSPAVEVANFRLPTNASYLQFERNRPMPSATVLYFYPDYAVCRQRTVWY